MPASALRDRKIDRAFGYLDVDRDGLIETEDVVALGNRLLQRFDLEPTSPKARAVMESFGTFWHVLLEQMDSDVDGRISPDEYRRGITAAFVDGPHFANVFRPAAQAVAELCDSDDDGVVGLEEFQLMQEAFGVDPDDIEPSFRRLDTDGDGQLGVEELVEAARQFYLSDDPDAVGNWLFGRV